MTPKRYSDLIAWQKAMELMEEVYKITKAFPKEELYGLTSQIRRAAISVPSNIAEGHGRTGSREFFHCLSIAQGSLSELETQIEIAARLSYITSEQKTRCLEMAAETGRIMNGLLNSLGKYAAAR
jgi:four helix bundle protein